MLLMLLVLQICLQKQQILIWLNTLEIPTMLKSIRVKINVLIPNSSTLMDAYFKYAQTLFNHEISTCASNYNERQIALKTTFQIFVILLSLDDVSESRFPNVVKSSHSAAVYTCCLEGQPIKAKLAQEAKLLVSVRE